VYNKAVATWYDAVGNVIETREDVERFIVYPYVGAGTWTTMAPIPIARVGYGAVEVGGIFYYIAGRSLEGYTTLNEAYNPARDKWTIKAPLPDDARAETDAVSDGSYVYLIGGSPVWWVGNDLWRYDPATDTWTSLAPMPTARVTQYMATYHNGRIYVMGGRWDFMPGWGAISTLEIYDIATNTWSAGASMPDARSDAVAIEYGGKIYVSGGFNAWGSITDTTFIYDIASNTWTTVAPMPERRAYPVGGKCADGIHVIGGLGSAWSFTTTNYAYHPATDTWTTSTPIPSATGAVQGVSYSGKIYVVGGFGPEWSLTTTNYAFQCADRPVQKYVIGPLTVKEKTNIQWKVMFEVTNPFSYTMTNVVITDRFGAEIEIDQKFPYRITQGKASYTLEGTTEQVHLTWNIGNLQPRETAKLTILVSTDINPAGKQEYTKPGIYAVNSGATLKFIDPEQNMQLSAVTAPIYVTVFPATDP